MNSIDLTPLYRTTVGFDRLADLLDTALWADTSTGGYPPYNIEALEENRYTITLAVAGFSSNELDVNVENDVLTVHGNKEKQTEHRFLHQGIANRPFERKFALAEYVKVTGAELKDGLLTVHLLKEVPEAMKPRSIPIQSGSTLIEHQDDQNSAQNEKAA